MTEAEVTDLQAVKIALATLSDEMMRLNFHLARLPCMRDRTDPHCPMALANADDDEPDSVVTRQVSWHAGPLSFRGPGIIGVLSFVAGALTLAGLHWLHLV